MTKLVKPFCAIDSDVSRFALGEAMYATQIRGNFFAFSFIRPFCIYLSLYFVGPVQRRTLPKISQYLRLVSVFYLLFLEEKNVF